MKKRINLLFCLVLLSVSMISCDPASQYEKELTEIDSCLAEMDTLENLYDGIVFDSLTLMVEHVEKNEADIKVLYRPDTLNETFGRQMSDSKSIRKLLKTNGKDKVLYGDELNAVKHQFMDLREDVLNGVLSDEQIHDYINVEKASLAKVKLAFMGFYKMQAQEKYRYYVVIPEVDKFIERLKAENDSIQ